MGAWDCKITSWWPLVQPTVNDIHIEIEWNVFACVYVLDVAYVQLGFIAIFTPNCASHIEDRYVDEPKHTHMWMTWNHFFSHRIASIELATTNTQQSEARRHTQQHSYVMNSNIYSVCTFLCDMWLQWCQISTNDMFIRNIILIISLFNKKKLSTYTYLYYIIQQIIHNGILFTVT